MAAHTYWRINVTAPVGGAGLYHVAMDEAEFYNAAGTKLSTGGTATASSYYLSSSLYSPDKAFDANWGTFWHSDVFPNGAGAPQWLKYQFSSPADIAAVRISYRSGNSIQAPKDFTIEWSDDNSAWTVSATYSYDWSTIGLGRTLTFPTVTPAAGSYANWRLRVLTTTGSVTPSGSEFELHETVAGADVTSTTPEYAIWSDQFAASYEGYRLFDNAIGTLWAALGAPPNFVGQALNRAMPIVEIKWQARNDVSYTQSPITGTMQATNNGVWTDMGTVTFVVWTSAGQSQTVAVVAPAGTGLLAHPGMTGVRPMLTGGLNA